jgi:integrase
MIFMRMPNGYGSIIKLSGNRRKPYMVRITKGYLDNGKQIYMYLGYYRKHDEALTALSEYNNNPYDITRDTITFEEVYKKWSSSHFEKVSTSAVENYSNAFNRYCQSLYKMRMKDIRLTHLQAVVDNSGKAHPTRAVIKTLLSVLYKFSLKNDIVAKDYATFIDVGENEGTKKRAPFTDKEIQLLWDNIDKLDFIDTVLIMIYSGMRVGEMLDIKISNVYIEDGYMIGGSKTRARKK